MNQEIETKIQAIKQLFDRLEERKAFQQLAELLNSNALDEKQRLNCELFKEKHSFRTWRGKEVEEGDKRIIHLIEKIKEHNNISLIIDAIDFYVQFLAHFTRYDEAHFFLEEAEEILERFKDKESREYKQSKIKLLKDRALLIHFNIKEINVLFDYLNQALLLAEEINDKMVLYDILYLIGFTKCHIGDYTIAIDYCQKILEFIEEIPVPKIETLNRLGAIYHFKGDYEKALSYYDEAYHQFKETPIWYKQIYYFNVSDLYFKKGELKKGKEFIDKGLKLIQDLEEMGAPILFGVGKAYQAKGDYDKALEFYFEVLPNFQKRKHKKFIGSVSLEIAKIFLDKGELEKAEEYCQLSLKNFGYFGGKYFLAATNYLLGKIYYVKGKLKKAMYHSQQSLKFRKSIENKPEVAQTLFLMTLIYLDENDIKQAEGFLDDLQKINEEIDNKIVKQMHRIAKALILKTRKRPRNWIKAMDLFEEIIHEEIVANDLTVIAMINYCELLLNEFQVSGDESVVKELDFYTERLLETAKLQESYSLSLEAYSLQILVKWLKAQYSMVTIDLQKANELLMDTRKMAEESGMLQLAKKITKRQDELLKKLEQWDQFIRNYYEFIKE
ncbi:MAG: tetratricopeptide repeat protein [Candidatus Heimdallarchaeota archaeon]|nr:tetratricopeptide repeat protein [Candidatus Heimdallarchaeota archaeon]